MFEQAVEDTSINRRMDALACFHAGVPSYDLGDDPSFPERFTDPFVGLVRPVSLQPIGPSSTAFPGILMEGMKTTQWYVA